MLPRSKDEDGGNMDLRNIGHNPEHLNFNFRRRESLKCRCYALTSMSDFRMCLAPVIELLHLEIILSTQIVE
jgi:hypothetical protein